MLNKSSMFSQCLRGDRSFSLKKYVVLRVRNFFAKCKSLLQSRNGNRKRYETSIPVRRNNIPKKTSPTIVEEPTIEEKIEIIRIDPANPVETKVASYLQEDKEERRADLDEAKKQLEELGRQDSDRNGSEYLLPGDSGDRDCDDDYELVFLEEENEERSVQEGVESDMP